MTEVNLWVGKYKALSILFLQIVTNGIYKSIEHRAIVNKDKERISIATSFSPKLDGNLGPAASLLTPQSPAQYRRIGVADYFKGFFSRELVGKSYIYRYSKDCKWRSWEQLINLAFYNECQNSHFLT